MQGLQFESIRQILHSVVVNLLNKFKFVSLFLGTMLVTCWKVDVKQ